MEYLTKVKKIPFGENGLYSTNGHYRKWYMSETDENMRILKELRKSKISK